MGVKITGLIEPITTTDTYPVIDPLLGIDGLRCVSSLTEMYNIPLERRRGGMLVGVQNNVNNDTVYYKLRPGVTWSVGTLSVTDWDPLFAYGTGSSALSLKYNISNETIVVPANHEYLLYGNLTIGTGGVFQTYGKTVLINGSVVLSGDGTYSVLGGGSLNLVSLSTTLKYTGTFSISPGATLSITHSLGSEDIVYSVRDGNNFVYPNIEIINSNSILLTSYGTISNGKINIMV
ncbi:hypothetical protein EBU71_12970 [bacterium]|nr:hypothetical protein [Candidatus Elulimicrobium humile]